MDFAGFTIATYGTLLALIILAILVFVIPIKGKKKRLFLRIGSCTVFAALAVGLMMVPSTHVYTVEGKVLTVDTHGDGKDDSDYSVINTDQSNKAFVVLRRDIPSVSEGDTVNLSCKTTSNDKVYMCDGEVQKTSSTSTNGS